MSYGNVMTEVDLQQHPMTLIVGKNAQGKSTICEVIAFALYGKAFRNINKPQLVNSINVSDCLVEVEFTISNKEYKVCRGIKPAVFEIYVNGALVPLVSSQDYQEYLETSILGMNYATFTQVILLGSAAYVPFMRLRPMERRVVVENILSIAIYSAMSQLAKQRLQEFKALETQYDTTDALLKKEIEIHTDYLGEVHRSNQTLVENLEREITVCDGDSAKLAAKISVIDAEIAGIDMRLKDRSKIEKSMKKTSTLLFGLRQKLEKLQENIRFYEQNATCPTCQQTIEQTKRDGLLTSKKTKMTEIGKAISSLETNIEDTQNQLEEMQRLQDIKDQQVGVRNDYVSSQKSTDKLRTRLQTDLRRMKAAQKSGTKETEAKILALEQDIKENEQNRAKTMRDKQILMSSLEILKDTGIKARIIRQYLPIINKQINQYLAALNFFIDIQLDEEFNEVIHSRYRDHFTYESFSEGEKLRIDLAILLTWRTIAKMQNSAWMNLLIMDEVFDSSLDNQGIEDFMRLLRGLQDGSNVFIISHKGDTLEDKFDAVLEVSKKNDFSRMELKC